MKSLCVFCGSSSGHSPVFTKVASELGTEMAKRGLELVYGGGNIGLMGVLADAVLRAGGRVFGVIPEMLAAKEVAHSQLTELRIVGSMHERKALMADRADAFLALPGGFGTFDEFCEILTWAQLGLHAKPCGILNVDGFYDALLAMFDHAAASGFLRPEHRKIVLAGTETKQILDDLKSARPVSLDKWIDRGNT